MSPDDFARSVVFKALEATLPRDEYLKYVVSDLTGIPVEHIQRVDIVDAANGRIDVLMKAQVETITVSLTVNK